MIKTLASSVRDYKLPSIATPILVLCEVACEMAIPFVTANLIDTIKDGAQIAQIMPTAGVLVGLALVSLFFGAAAGVTCSYASCGFAKNLRHDLFYKIQTFSFANIDRFSSSSLVTRLTTDVTNVQQAFMLIIRIAVRAPLVLVFAFAMAYAMGGYISFVYLAMIPLLGCGLGFIIHKVGPIFTRVFHKYDALNESVEENVTGMRVVKSYVRESYEKEKFARAAEDVRADFTRAEKLLALNNPMMNLCVNGAFVVIIYLGSKLIITSQGALFDVGQLSSTFTYGFQILMSLMQLSMIFVMVTMSEESANRIVEVLNAEPTITNPAEAACEVADGSIDFDHVSFKYSEHAERQALDDIDLHIASGETIGIIGGTGSAKSTLVNLIARLYDATEGTVRVGGRDVRSYDLDALRHEVAMVLQKNVLFSGTIAENLRWGDENATDEEVREAAHLACADEFIDGFPKGYDTWIEQGGSNVSGGQKQRLCIARALLRRPKILILDDSTSAVDTKTDAKIRAGLAAYLPETTKLIIAQRIASVQDADRIIVMEGGRIAAMGTHEELLETSEIYRETFTSQNKMGEETVDGDGSPHAGNDAPAARETVDADRQTAEELAHAFETTMQEGGEAHE
ncbi:ABC transporter ATP-binding protein [Collinsella intestinalis]|uniref:ABC transporter ATP-binding protein n=1 Tax=Collinsella intestinalis TaxID=147207 RepID=A0A414NDY3_9ACTN|nr:ABC transporter ATP-binding protein [Collinsella intestinalis]RHF36972.1 ABC transporter ATP-binding protein [Collinsella intestinalis]